jgi:ABC-2 type transport system permease protein
MTRRIVALAWLNLQQLLRNPTEVVALVVLPLALTMVFGSTFANVEGKPARVPFVDEDGTAYSAQVLELLEEEPSFAVESMEREAAEQLVIDGEVSAAVIVPDGFAAAIKEGTAEIQTLVDPASTSAFAVTAVAQGIAVRMSGNAAAADAVTALPSSSREFEEVYQAADALWEPVPPVSVEGQTVVASAVRGESVQASGTTQSSAGFTVFFIMFATFGGAGAILEEREQGTLRRLLVTPSSRTTLITGKIVGIVITAVIQTLILTIAGAALFGVPWGEQWLANAAILFCYILAVTGLAVLVSTLVRSRDQFSGLAPIFSTGLAMLGGCFWPLDIVGPVMQTVAKATPTGWAMTGLTDVLARNQGLEAAWLPSVVLLGFAAVTLGLGVRSLKWE